uniref:Prolyl endopeptidase n=1 Tax=Physcomitrium patens TaxID=3218 RepID=A0A7I4C0B8_PHYPA
MAPLLKSNVISFMPEVMPCKSRMWPLTYPRFERDETCIESMHGHKIPDPYRPLEVPKARATQEFIASQVELTKSVLSTCDTKEKLRERITAVYDYPKSSCPYRRGNKCFYSHNSGLQAQSVLYMQDSLDGEAEVLLDPNTWSEDGTKSLEIMKFSSNAEYLAYGQSSSGSDWITIKVIHVADKITLDDTLSWVKFSSLAWTHDNRGFFYNRYPKPTMNEIEDEGTETDSNLFQELRYHFLGTDQSQDILCWRDSEHAQWFSRAEITDDGQYLVLSIEESCDPVNRLYYCNLSTLPQGLEGLRQNKEHLPMIKLIDNFDAQYELVANEGSLFTFLTNKDAPKNKLTRVSLDDPSSWKDVVPESESDVLTSADLVNRQQLVLCYMSDVKHLLQLNDLQSGHLLQKLPLEIGSICEISSRPEDADFFYSFTSFLTPGIIYRCDLSSGTPDLSVLKETKIANWDRSLFEIRQEFATSKDETRVPMFVVAKKGLVRNGDHPAVLYGYGGFNVSLMPYFSVSRLVLVQHYGAVVATANTRGGGEYGEKWHKAGALANKQNCFDDFIACGEHLIKEGYTQNKKLCIEGGSNGGLLVAVCINQRPDLFGCALAHVGVMDMLRFQKFTIGHAWISDYGCADIAEEFDWLIKYSPLHNVKRPWENGTKSIQYPATMLFTADHDDRVVPSHSLKLLAYELCTSLDNSQQTNPIIGRIETKAGHGSGRPTMKIIDEMVDAYSFFAKMTDSAWIE